MGTIGPLPHPAPPGTHPSTPGHGPHGGFDGTGWGGYMRGRFPGVKADTICDRVETWINSDNPWPLDFMIDPTTFPVRFKQIYDELVKRNLWDPLLAKLGLSAPPAP